MCRDDPSRSGSLLRKTPLLVPMFIAAVGAGAASGQFLPPTIDPRPDYVSLRVDVLREGRAVPVATLIRDFAYFEEAVLELPDARLFIRPLGIEHRRWLRTEIREERAGRTSAQVVRLKLHGSSAMPRRGEMEAGLRDPKLRVHLTAETRR